MQHRAQPPAVVCEAQAVKSSSMSSIRGGGGAYPRHDPLPLQGPKPMVLELTALHRTVHQRFYFSAVICTALVIFADSSKTYCLKTIFETPPLSSLLHVHGIVMSS